MVKKFNLSEAAAEILNKSVAAAKKGVEGPSKLPASVVAGQKEVGDIGGDVTKTTDDGPDATKGVATATPPGATPPVGSEPMKKLSGQPGQSQGAETDAPEGKPDKQMMPKNKNGVGVQSYGGQKNEETEQTANDSNILDIQEDIAALLQGEQLSEEFVKKATTIFEAAVISRVEEVAKEVESQLHEQFESAVQELKEDYAAKIDDYLNYMVEEWMKENELAIESGLRAEIVDDFITGLQKLFAEHYINIPEEKVDVVEEMSAKVEELEEKLNDEIKHSIELRKTINEQKKIQIIQTVCEGLTQTQVEKLKSLAESVEFTTEEEFAEKINTLKEAYAPSVVKAAEKSALEEGVEVPEDKPTKTSGDPLINAVVNSISKSMVK